MAKQRIVTVHDKRSKLDLELFVLAMVLRGVNTPYQLLSAAGISQGASMPALGRLENAGYVRRGKPASRGRMEFTVTAAGRRYLQTGWRTLLELPVSGDIETTLRAASLAVLSGADKKIVTTYLKSAANAKATDSKNRKAEAKQAKAVLGEQPDGGLYTWMLVMQATTRLAAEAKLLRQLATALTQRP
jgi:DNA-binding PadR family transcriptional regulator